MDSGIVHLLYSCGWMGAAMYLAGIVLFLRRLPTPRSSADPMAPVYSAVLVAITFELLFATVLIGPAAAMLWTYIGLGWSLRHVEQGSSLLPEHHRPLMPETRTGAALLA
jgi:hypothetical protein